VATVDGNGFVTAQAVGSATITATSEGKNGASAITVNATQTLVGAGNIANCSSTNPNATAALLDNIPGTVFTSGDNIYGDGTINDFNSCYNPAWGRHKARTRPATGHKDYQAVGAVGYWQYFGPAGGDSGKYYYSYDLGAWHVVVLNSQIDMSVGSAQEVWLKNDLASHPGVCTLAYWHQPVFSSGGRASANAVQFWNDLYNAHADVVLTGHDHIYERFAAQGRAAGVNSAPADPLGVREFIAGTGGADHTSLASSPAPNSEKRDATTFGVLKLTLRAGAYDWAFLPDAQSGNGTFTDAGSDVCH
jgi:hypothetical protein